MVPLKKLQEASLGPGRPLDPPETQVVTGSLQVPHVHRQVLQPEARPLSYGGELGGPGARRRVEEGEQRFATEKSKNLEENMWTDSLVVCEAKRRKVFVFLCEVCQPVDGPRQLEEDSVVT